MTSNKNSPQTVQDATVRVRLARDAGYPDLVPLLYNLSISGQHRICLNVSAVSHLGTTEFRLLGIHAEQCREHGGFLKLENANAKLTAVIRSYGYQALLASTTGQVAPARDIF